MGLSDRLLEIAVLVTAREMDSQYEWTEWETYGRDPNDPRHIEPAIIDIIKYNKPVAGLGEKETAIISLGREMLGQRKVSSDDVRRRSASIRPQRHCGCGLGDGQLFRCRIGADGFRSALAGRTKTVASPAVDALWGDSDRCEFRNSG